jgi:hypothetical protein
MSILCVIGSILRLLWSAYPTALNVAFIKRTQTFGAFCWWNDIHKQKTCSKEALSRQDLGERHPLTGANFPCRTIYGGIMAHVWMCFSTFLSAWPQTKSAVDDLFSVVKPSTILQTHLLICHLLLFNSGLVSHSCDSRGTRRAKISLGLV